MSPISIKRKKTQNADFYDRQKHYKWFRIKRQILRPSTWTADCRVFQLSSWSLWHLFSVSLMPVFQVPTNAKVHKLTSYLLLTLYLYCIIATGICSIGTCKFRSFWCIFWTRTSEKFSKLSGLLALKFYLSENYLVLAGLKCVTQIKTKINKNSRLEYLSALEL